jgi:hypothetical protein
MFRAQNWSNTRGWVDLEDREVDSEWRPAAELPRNRSSRARGD